MMAACGAWERVAATKLALISKAAVLTLFLCSADNGPPQRLSGRLFVPRHDLQDPCSLVVGGVRDLTLTPTKAFLVQALVKLPVGGATRQAAIRRPVNDPLHPVPAQFKQIGRLGQREQQPPITCTAKFSICTINCELGSAHGVPTVPTTYSGQRHIGTRPRIIVKNCITLKYSHPRCEA